MPLLGLLISTTFALSHGQMSENPLWAIKISKPSEQRLKTVRKAFSHDWFLPGCTSVLIKVSPACLPGQSLVYFAGHYAGYCKHEVPVPVMLRACVQSDSACGSGTNYPLQCICAKYFNYKSCNYVVGVDRYSGWTVVQQSRDGSSCLVKCLRELFHI